MNYVESFNLFGVEAKQIPCLTEKGVPTAETVGAVGLLYMDTDTGALYKCTAAEAGVYTWEVAEGSADGLPDVTTNDNGKILRVVDGAWGAVSLDSAEEASF